MPIIYIYISISCPWWVIGVFQNARCSRRPQIIKFRCWETAVENFDAVPFLQLSQLAIACVVTPVEINWHGTFVKHDLNCDLYGRNQVWHLPQWLPSVLLPFIATVASSFCCHLIDICVNFSFIYFLHVLVIIYYYKE